MDIYKLIHIVIRRIKLILIVPIIAGLAMYFAGTNNKLTYTSKASIFTAITSNTSLENLGNNRVDYFATKTAYNNLLSILNSRDVIEETALRLLASHLISDGTNPTVISQESYIALNEILPSEVKELTNINSAELTYLNLLDYMNQNKENFLYGLLNFNHPHYSYKAISNVTAVQDGSSDVILLTYQSDDAAIAYRTLEILIDVFIRKYSKLKQSQTGSAVGYFEKQLAISAAKLKDAEDRLLNFNKSNDIINYYEQTKHISSQQEKIEIKLQDVVMEFEAAKAVLEKLEIETKNRFNINLRNKELMDIRQELIKINLNIAEEQIEGNSNSFVSTEIQRYAQQKQQLEIQLQNKLDSLYILNHNSEGIAIETILGDWLKTVIEYESAQARLLAMEAKEKEFKELYSKFAPLGAILKRIEREIDVCEKEYLEILHHLGLARLKQQNEELMANMKVVDKPQLPIDPEPDKGKLMIIVVAVFSLLLTMLGIIGFELLDKTIKTVSRFANLSKLAIAGAQAKLSSKNVLVVESVNRSGSKKLLETIIEKASSSKSKNGIVIEFTSNWNGEGKSGLIKNIQAKLTEYGYKVGTARFSGEITDDQSINLPVKKLFEHNTYQSLLQKELSEYDIVLVEIPAGKENTMNVNLFRTADIACFVANAQRTWSSADSFLLEELVKHHENKLLGFLTNVSIDNMEEITGEIPKKRSKIRRFIKTQVSKRIGQ